MSDRPVYIDALTFYVKLGTWDQAQEGDPRTELVTVYIECMTHDQYVEVLMRVVNDQSIGMDERVEPLRHGVICASVAEWRGRRPKGVTPYGVSRAAVGNIPIWMQELIAQRSRELYNAMMKTLQKEWQEEAKGS